LIGKSEDTSDGNTWSYLDDPRHYINPDPAYAENFVFADVKPGEYEVYTEVQGKVYRVPVQVVAGAVSTVEIVTEPYQVPTVTPEATAVPTSDELDSEKTSWVMPTTMNEIGQRIYAN
jgi:D-aminopeptidase